MEVGVRDRDLEPISESFQGVIAKLREKGFFVTSITLVAGRTHLMLGLVHFVVFCAFLFLSLVP